MTVSQQFQNTQYVTNTCDDENQVSIKFEIPQQASKNREACRLRLVTIQIQIQSKYI